MLSFAATVFLMIITPGPGVLTTAGVGSGFGVRAGLVFLVGLFVGTNLVALGVVSGLAAVILTNEVIRTVFMFLSAGYLLYLAARIALSGAKIAFIEKAAPPGFVGGVLLQIINPKAYAVNTALFFNFPFYPDSLSVEIALKFLLINIVWVPVHLTWLGMGVFLHRLDLSPRTLTVINSAMALAMLIVVGLTTWSAIQAMGATAGQAG